MSFCIPMVLTTVPGRPQMLSRYQPTLPQTSPGFQLEQGSVSNNWSLEIEVESQRRETKAQEVGWKEVRTKGIPLIGPPSIPFP